MTKSVLITGCSAGGIGNALARAFASRGFMVFATAREASRMENLVVLPNITCIVLDVTSPDRIAAIVETVREKTDGTLDYLINNAGQHYTMPMLDTNLDAAKALFEVNFWAVLQMTQSLSPLLIKAKGTIVNISSITAVTPIPWMSAYSASKAALNAITTTLRYETASFGVRVVTVMTGVVQSRIADNAPPFKLPKESRYSRVEKSLNILASGMAVDGSKMTKTDTYAEQVLSDILTKKTVTIWRGKYARLTRWVVRRLPEPMQFRLFMKE